MITTSMQIQGDINALIKVAAIDRTSFFQWAREVLLALRASNVNRVHNQGKAVDETEIGKYSVKPMYINPNNSPNKFSGKGKYGESKFKNGNEHKTRYFEDGYKGFRNINGRDTSKVNLQLTGSLKEAFQIFEQGNEISLGFEDAKSEIRKGLEKKYGKQIWGITNQDNETINLITERYLNMLLK